MLLWDGSDETERWKLAVLDTKKSVFKAGNRVERTWFLCLETESIGLDFYAEKPSPLDLFSMQRNRVLWTCFLPTFFVREQLSSCRNRALFTRIARNQNSLKRFLTNDIVWVLLLFSKKSPISGGT